MSIMAIIIKAAAWFLYWLNEMLCIWWMLWCATLIPLQNEDIFPQLSKIICLSASCCTGRKLKVVILFLWGSPLMTSYSGRYEDLVPYTPTWICLRSHLSTRAPYGSWKSSLSYAWFCFLSQLLIPRALPQLLLRACSQWSKPMTLEVVHRQTLRWDLGADHHLLAAKENAVSGRWNTHCPGSWLHF